MNHVLNNEQIIDLNNMFDNVEVLDLRDENNELFKQISNISVDANLNDLAEQLLNVAKEFDMVILPIGSPAFMFKFATKTHANMNITFLFAHSDRSVIEKTNNDGTITKTSVFKHVKFLVM
ncbi:MAG TPA: hypothetical protein PLK02_06915 [Paludibacteraceae bacterium]|nr:hypothetical protein [Paludibacteraceae bacterium]